MRAKRLREFEMDDDVYIDPLEEELLSLPRDARARLAELLFSSIGDGGHPQPFPVEQALADLHRIIRMDPGGSYGNGEVREVADEVALKRLEADLLAQPATVRGLTANLLLSSLKTREEVETAWASEIERRHRKYLAGEITGIPAEEFIARARDRARRGR